MYKNINISIYLVIFLILLMFGVYKITNANAEIKENDLFKFLAMEDIQLIRDTSCGNGEKEHIFDEEKSIQIINILKGTHIEESEKDGIFYGGYSVQIRYKDGGIDNILFPIEEYMCYNGTYYKIDKHSFYNIISLLKRERISDNSKLN